ncbi:MAG: hypothetical protein PUI07_03775 [Clostridiales bacterium]|nr:hypothetical protein [Clostridiales bacterium]
MTKRLTAIFLAVLAVLTLAACGQGETAPGTMGTMLVQVFEERGKADPNLDLTDLGNTLMNDSGLPIDGEVTPVEPGLLMGFGNDEITGFAEGVMFAPVIGTIPFVGYLFRLDAGTDGDAFVQTLKDQANPRWNICTEADETVVRREGDVVFFVMCPQSMDEDGGDGVSDLS